MNSPDHVPPRRRHALDRRRHAIRPLVESLEQRLQLSLTPAAAAAQIASGTSPNYYHQHEPSVAMDAAGDYVVAWVDNLNSTGYTAEIEARVFSASGTAKTGVIAVSPTPTPNNYTAYTPAVAMDPNGDFVVTWGLTPPQPSTSGYYYDIEAQRFNLIGTAQGGEIQVTAQTKTPNELETPTVAMDNSSFVIGWSDFLNAPYTNTIYAQRFNFSGSTNTPVGSTITVAHSNTSTMTTAGSPLVAMDSGGDFVFVYDVDTPSTNSVQVQAYNASGVAQGLLLSVNPSTRTGNPSVAMNGTGQFVIAYTIFTTSTTSPPYSYADVYANQYVLAGTESNLSVTTLKSGVEVDPQPYPDDQDDPTAAIDGQGIATIAWEDYDETNSEGASGDDTIDAIRLNPDGSLVQTTPFAVAAPTTTYNFYNLHAASGASNDVDFVWELDPYGNPTPGSGEVIDDRPYLYVNDAPTIAGPIANQKVAENGSTTVPLTGITAGGNEEQTLSVTASSTNTSLIVPTVTYTSPNSTGTLNINPVAGQFGTATITVTVTDSGGIANGGTNTKSVQFTLTVVGQPTASNQSVTVPFNSAKAITLTGSDPNSPALSLTYTVTGGPLHGTLSGTAPNLTYTPTAGYFGPDSFTFTDSNGTVTSSPATVSITVVGKPTANNQSVTVPINSTADPITLTGSDPDSPPLSLTYAFTQPAHGSVAVSGSAGSPTVTYTPTAGYSGADSFTFTDSNGTVTSSAATVSITVVGKPTANNQSVTVALNTAKMITLTGSDPDSPPLSLTYAFTQPAHGSVAVSGSAGSPTVIYTPTSGYFGPDSFTFTDSNGTVTSSPATVSITVVGQPTANAQSVTVPLNSSADPITLTGSDPNSPPRSLTYSFTQPMHGSVAVSGSAGSPTVTYTPTAGYFGPDSFTFTDSNGTVTSSPATVSITVVGQPTANAQTVNNVAHDSSANSITLTGSDPDMPARSLTYAFTQPMHGTVAVSGSPGSPTVTYTPVTGFHGTDTFSFTVNNGTVTSNPATVTLNVNVGTPTAIAQTVPTPANTAVAITLTGSDDDAPALPLTYAIVAGQGPANGAITGFNPATGALTYTPNAGYSGTDSFEFTASNGTNTSVPAVETIHVIAPSQATVGGSVGVTWGTAGSATLLTNGDGLRLLPAGRNIDLPWLGINKLSITLSQAETLSPADVSVTGITVANYGPVTISGSGTSYTITLAQPINAADRVTVTIGNATIATFTRRLDVLPGDVNDDGSVTSGDVSAALAYSGQVYLFADIDGDGSVTTADTRKIRGLNGTQLPSLA